MPTFQDLLRQYGFGSFLDERGLPNAQGGLPPAGAPVSPFDPFGAMPPPPGTDMMAPPPSVETQPQDLGLVGLNSGAAPNPLANLFSFKGGGGGDEMPDLLAGLLPILMGAKGGALLPTNPLNLPPEDAKTLWKPEGEHSGNLVFLASPTYAGRIQGVTVTGADGQTVSGVYSGNANGGRDHFRFPAPGGAFGENVKVNLQLRDGGVRTYVIPNGAMRWEGVPSAG